MYGRKFEPGNNGMWHIASCTSW